MSSERCWIVTWVAEPMPHDQWSGDRFWPFVEVYEAWGDAFKRLGELTDRGYTATFRAVGYHASSGGVPEPTKEPK